MYPLDHVPIYHVFPMLNISIATNASWLSKTFHFNFSPFSSQRTSKSKTKSNYSDHLTNQSYYSAHPIFADTGSSATRSRPRHTSTQTEPAESTMLPPTCLRRASRTTTSLSLATLRISVMSNFTTICTLTTSVSAPWTLGFLR